jgi:hypothetical protein
MKTAIIVILCVIGYLAIGFVMLVLRASKCWIDGEDTAIVLLFWPIVGVLYGVCYVGERIKDLAQDLGGKLAKKIPKK